MSKRKKLEKQIGADTDALRHDLRKLRDDVVALLRSRRRRGSEAAGAQVRAVVTEVRERPARRGEFPEEPGRRQRGWAMRQSPARKRRLAVLLALGAVAYLLLRKREAVVAESAEPRHGWRARLPWTARSRRAAVPTETHEPTVGVTPSESGAVTAGREGAPVETPEKVTSF